jgi:hypothetical protein
MKKLFTIAITALSINAFAQTTVCFNTPDGIDNTWTGGWSYKEYIIPTGYKIDSVYGDFDRTGYPASQEDFIFSFNAGTAVYNNTTATQPFDYSTTSTSLYDHWIDLTSFNYASVGVVRVFLPVNAGATWNDLCFAISPISNNTVCFNTPDGIDNTWTGGWSYKEYIVPTGYKIDSVYGDFDRTGYPASQEDFIFSFNAGTTVYNNTTATQPFDYSTTSTSLYDHWIDLTSFNYASVGVVRVFLPVNAGATWNDLCFAISPSTTTGLNENAMNTNSFIYPNPSTDRINLNTAEVLDIRIYNYTGQIVKAIPNNSGQIDVSDLNNGIYFLQVSNKNSSTSSIYKFIKN